MSNHILQATVCLLEKRQQCEQQREAETNIIRKKRITYRKKMRQMVQEFLVCTHRDKTRLTILFHIVFNNEDKKYRNGIRG